MTNSYTTELSWVVSQCTDKYLFYLYSITFKACVVPGRVPVDVIDSVNELYLCERERDIMCTFTAICNIRILQGETPLETSLPITSTSTMLFFTVDSANEEVIPAPNKVLLPEANSGTP